jgi:pyridoxal phosphate enzyme (YggS family)
MAEIAEQIRSVRAYIPAGVTLVCVSKYQPIEAIREAYKAGERHFGESRVQELKAKVAQLPADIHWHFIGHLQTNKVRDLLKIFADKSVSRPPLLIQSVDSEHLLQVINEEAEKQGITQDVLLELHTAKEETKTGLEPANIETILDFTPERYPNIRIQGLMTMATNTDDEAEIKRCFLTAQRSYSETFLQSEGRSYSEAVLSMGMSDDYRLAIACGATMVRIGSSIFGERERRIKAVFFDQDGVLYNSMPYHAEAWAWAMTKHGLPYTAIECYRNEGRTSTGVIQEHHQQMFGTDATPELIEAIYKDKTEYFTRQTGGFPGIIPHVDDVIRYLRANGIQCWVVTGSGQRNLIDALNDTFDNAFTGIISSFDVKHGKPDPEPYLKAWERSGFAKDECLVIENAPLGVRAGKAAGLRTIAVNTGILPDSDLAAEGADLVLPNMEALLHWFNKK